MKDRILPHDIETEQALLSGLIINNTGFKSLGKLKADDFYKQSHKVLFKAMSELLKAGESIDLITLRPFLKKTNQLKQVGGDKYLLFIADSAPIAFDVKSYAKIVKDFSTTRQAILLCMQIIDSGYCSTDTKGFILDAQEKIMGIETSSGKDTFYDMSALMDETITRIESVQKLKQSINLDFGMPSLSNAMFISGSKLIIISARPGMGKTALMLSLSKHLANQEVKNGILSIEMDREEISDRFLSVEADVNSLKFYAKGQFDDIGISNLERFAGDLSYLPILVDDSKCDIEDVKRKCRKMKNEGCKIIFIDQLSKISYSSKLSEFQGYSRNCAEIAILKKELRIPIVLLCQIGRKVEERANKRPMLSDLKQTGQIEEDADMVFFIYRDGYYDKKVDPSRTEISLQKNRNGALGVEHQVIFSPKRALFKLTV
jgi:replicative DNA helicase